MRVSDDGPGDSVEPADTSGRVDSALEPMARVRPGEPVAERLAQVRVLGALFGHEQPSATFGRFHVLRRLGAGGMGVVYEAYDPDLARGVALKIVDVATKDRETALAEAKALARLSHPNVVPIYDVGIDADRVYLVMELVRGRTLNDWPAPPGVREVLEAYRQAGAALAAAHEVGLVHRDFKPANAMIGADRRVRVIDFGLACEAEASARTGAQRGAVGTKGFIAPEIATGAAVTPAADQYSFCVALASTIELAKEPVPRWIAAVIERGRASAPADRFASMDDLLRALARDPARAKRRLLAVGAIAVAIGAAFLAGQRDPPASDELAVCDEQSAAQLAAAWSRTEQTAALDRVAGLGDYGRSIAPQLRTVLEARADQWLSEYRSACRARLSSRTPDLRDERRMACLMRSRDALAAVASHLRTATAAKLAELPRAAQAIPPPAACSDLETLLSDIPLPPPSIRAAVAQLETRLTRARVELAAGRYEPARDHALAVVAAARELTPIHAPLLAEALLVAGHAWMMVDKKASVPTLVEATSVAMEANAATLAVEAWARRAWAQGTSYDPGGALAGLELIEPLARRMPSARFARALLHNNVGGVELARDRRDRARAAFDRARTEALDLPSPRPIELVVISANLALVTDDRSRADALLAEAIDELARRLGEDHPDTLAVRWIRATVTIEGLAQAPDYVTPICRAYDHHPTLARDTALCWREVGMLRWELERPRDAIEPMERAARMSPAEAPDAPPYAALLRGAPRDAARQLEGLVAARPASSNEPWWERLVRGELLLALGRAHRAQHEFVRARQALERAIPDLESAVRAVPTAFHERQLGRARVEFAFVLAASHAATSDVTAVARPAVAWMRRVSGDAGRLRELEDLLEQVP